jgi:hypothetical protein
MGNWHTGEKWHIMINANMSKLALERKGHT